MRFFLVIVMLPALLAIGFGEPTQDPSEVLPKLVHHAQPVYPQLARQARVQGDVVVRITTDGESVVEAKAESGPEMLRKVSEDCAITWKFATHTPGAFHVTFRYVLASPAVVTVFPESGSVVQVIEARAPEMSIYYSSIDLGWWKAQLKSAHGESFRTFRFSSTGSQGKWLDGSSTNAKGVKEETDFGQIDGKLLVFEMKFSQPDGKRLNTFFVGRKNGDKMAGTFVDDAGISGEWMAERQQQRKR